MSEQQLDFPAIDLKPVISYPREAQAGQTYLMTIDVQVASPGAPWPYLEEEYPISFILDTQPYFSYEPLDGHESSVILHRFGGTYGPVQYVLTATKQAVEPGHIHVTLINGGGLPIGHLELECAIKQMVDARTKQKKVQVSAKEKKAASKKQKLIPIKESDVTINVPDAYALITEQLRQTGWRVQDVSSMTPTQPLHGLAIRGYLPLVDSYLLFLHNEPIGAIRVQTPGTSLAGTEEPISRSQIPNFYASGKTEPVPYGSGPYGSDTYGVSISYSVLPFVYDSTGLEASFTNYLEPEPRSRRVLTFHRPETMERWLSQAHPYMPATENDLLRSRLRRMPPVEETKLYDRGVWQAIAELEKSLQANRSRALVQIPSGSGKTIVLAHLAYRLLHFAHAQRVLFLVNSDGSAQTAYDCLKLIRIPDTGKSFVEQFNVQILQKDVIDPNANICIFTIEQFYLFFTKRVPFPLPAEQDNALPMTSSEVFKAYNLSYNPSIPIEFFDTILINNWAPGVYREWRFLLEYFDAFIIGASINAERSILGFFGRNLVYDYMEANPSRTFVQYLWKYYDELRDYGFSLEDYLEQLTYLLFLKAEYEHLRIQSLTTASASEGYNWATLLSEQPDYAISDYYRQALYIHHSQPGIIGDIFRNANTRFLSPSRLRGLIQLIEREYPTKVNGNILGDIYEELLEKGAENTKTGMSQYFTPRALVQTVVDVMQPRAEMRVCDPACGVGGFLVAAYKHATDEEKHVLSAKEQAHLHEKFLSGWERNENIIKLCAMDLFAHNIMAEYEWSPIRKGDSLLGMHIPDLFEMVLSNPPFGRKFDYRGMSNREAGWGIFTRDADFAYVQLAYALLKPYGRAAIVVPNGVLFRNPEGVGAMIRRRLLETCDFHTLLLLPENTFYHTGISGAVLFFDKMPADENSGTKELWIYDLRTNMHFTQRKNPLRRKHFEDFVRCYHAEDRRLRQETERFRRFSYEELIKREGCNFNISWLHEQGQTVTRETIDQRFSNWLANQQRTRKQPFTDEQILWLERIRYRIATDGKFTEEDFERTPFSFDGGLVVARVLFGNELSEILQELNRLLV